MHGPVNVKECQIAIFIYGLSKKSGSLSLQELYGLAIDLCRNCFTFDISQESNKKRRKYTIDIKFLPIHVLKA
jgi:hypothetical protein